MLKGLPEAPQLLKMDRPIPEPIVCLLSQSGFPTWGGELVGLTLS